MFVFLALGLLALAGIKQVEAQVRSPRAHNFGAGPAALPDAVLARAQAEFLDWQGSGMSVLEWTNLDSGGPSHPGVAAPGQKLQEMMLATEAKLRKVIAIPSDYRVLFMHGGAVAQFSAIPMNLLGSDGAQADYIDSGFWSRRSAQEASKYGDIKTIATFVGDSAPPWEQWALAARKGATYLHVCLSETVQGVELLTDPPRDWQGPAVVVDATSTLLSRPIDVAAYALIYASGGKNLPAGMATVIVKQSLLLSTKPLAITPAIFDYRTHGGALQPTASVFESRPNTPPTFASYMLGLVLDHLEDEGGVSAMHAKVTARATALYEAAARAGGGVFYVNKVHPHARSRMNAIFKLPTPELDKLFVREAEQAGFLHLYGHPVLGGIRVTMYNWVRDESVYSLIKFMEDFADKHAKEL
jgi:phosphoserine aminotransferase